MRRISDLTAEQVIAYNLRDNGNAYTVFEDTQPERVRHARQLIADIIGRDPRHRHRIIELGCGAGDISGPFSHIHDVIGIDVTPGAVEKARERFPQMVVSGGNAEDLPVTSCDILVLTEFLEHIQAPVTLVGAWLPYAKYAVIGHPLNDPGGLEPGHVWSYTEDDFAFWHGVGGHKAIRTERFPMPPFPGMIIGSSERVR